MVVKLQGVPARSARGPAALQDERHAARPICQNHRPLPAAGSAGSARGRRCADRRVSGRSLFSRAEGSDAVRERASKKRSRPIARRWSCARRSAAQGRPRPGSDRERRADAMPRRSPISGEAVAREPTNASAWRLLGIAQGRDGLEGVSNLSLAEYALLIGKQDDARLYAHRGADGPEQSGLAQASGTCCA